MFVNMDDMLKVIDNRACCIAESRKSEWVETKDLIDSMLSIESSLLRIVISKYEPIQFSLNGINEVGFINGLPKSDRYKSHFINAVRYLDQKTGDCITERELLMAMLDHDTSLAFVLVRAGINKHILMLHLLKMLNPAKSPSIGIDAILWLDETYSRKIADIDLTKELGFRYAVSLLCELLRELTLDAVVDTFENRQ